MTRKRDITERQISEYIKDEAQKNSIFQKPISRIAEETNCSTSTVWRVIQKLQDKRIIKVIKSKSATEPDIIYYLGEQNEASPLIEQINGYLNSVSILIKELSIQLDQKQQMIDTLRYEIEMHRSKEEKILSVVKKED
jgi:DNA-binding Lrp family transcriptional regulator